MSEEKGMVSEHLTDSETWFPDNEHSKGTYKALSEGRCIVTMSEKDKNRYSEGFILDYNDSKILVPNQFKGDR